MSRGQEVGRFESSEKSSSGFKADPGKETLNSMACMAGGGQAVPWDRELKQPGKSKDRERGTHKCAKLLNHSSSVPGY